MNRLIEYLATGITDASGDPIALGKVKFYDVETRMLAPVFQDVDLTIPHSNPATLDSAGRLTAFTDRRLKLLVSDSSDGYLFSIDGVGSSRSAIQPGDFASNSVTTAKIADGGVSDANIDDNSVSGSVLANGAANAAAIANQAVTRPKQADSVYQVSATDSASFATSSTASFVDVTGASATVSASGTRPVLILFKGGRAFPFAAGQYLYLQLWKNGTSEVGRTQMGGSSLNITCPSQAYRFLDTSPTAGSNTYQLRAMVSVNTGTAKVWFFKGFAMEL